MQILLQILDEGKLHDSQGHAIDFKNTIIILTSNMGSHILANPASSDANGVVTPEASREVLDLVAQSYPPELLNRLDQQIVFNRLGRQSMHDLVDLRLKEVAATLESKRLKLEADESARDWLAEHGYSAVYGARELNRLINKTVRSPLADQLISGNIQYVHSPPTHSLAKLPWAVLTKCISFFSADLDRPYCSQSRTTLLWSGPSRALTLVIRSRCWISNSTIYNSL